MAKSELHLLPHSRKHKESLCGVSLPQQFMRLEADGTVSRTFVTSDEDKCEDCVEKYEGQRAVADGDAPVARDSRDGDDDGRPAPRRRTEG